MKSLLAFAMIAAVSSALAGGSVALAQSAPTKPTQSAPTAKAETFKNLNVAEFEKLRARKTNVVLDVRTKAEYDEGHIPGAVHIDVNAPDFAEKAAKLDKDQTYLVHCRSGRRSVTACEKLSPAGFAKLFNLKGGMLEWEKAGHKAEKK